MTQTIYMESLDELQDFYDGIADDFNQIEFDPWMQAELGLMADWHDGLFQSATDPGGTPWPPLAPSTITRKGHSTILVDTGRLRQSLRLKGNQSTGDAVREGIQSDLTSYMTFGTVVEYGPYHDQASGTRPARRHVGINEEYMDRMTVRACDFTIKELAEAG